METAEILIRVLRSCGPIIHLGAVEQGYHYVARGQHVAASLHDLAGRIITPRHDIIGGEQFIGPDDRMVRLSLDARLRGAVPSPVGGGEERACEVDGHFLLFIHLNGAVFP